jgi:hypothetical protein
VLKQEQTTLQKQNNNISFFMSAEPTFFWGAALGFFLGCCFICFFFGAERIFIFVLLLLLFLGVAEKLIGFVICSCFLLAAKLPKTPPGLKQQHLAKAKN